MNFYPFHIGDYASATRHLSWDEDMAYRRLMDAYYTREAPIPLDRRQAYRLVCAASEEQRTAVDVVLAEFFEESPDGWRNARCDAEIEVCRQKSEKASQSAKARWSHANAMRPHSERIAGENDAKSETEEIAPNEPSAMQSDCERNANASKQPCERISGTCEGNAPNTNTNISKPNGLDIGARKSRPTRKCPPDFEITPEMRAWAAANAGLASIDAATEAFRDHTFKNAISDWSGAWRNWMRRDHQYAQEKQKGPSRRAPVRENFDAINYGEGISPL